MAQMAFIHSPLDRMANHRSDESWLQARANDKNAQFVQIFKDSVRMRGETLAKAPPKSRGELVFLGEDEAHQPWFAFSGETPDEMTPLRPLMVGNLLPEGELSILAQARSLVHWHTQHRFCSNCGAPTLMSDGGYRRHCPACKVDHFPRTDPVVIMAVVHGSQMLLGRQKAWAPGMYSALAGFMEPGETIEQAVAREVLEETAVVTGTVNYVASQPWPFPSTLMIGCVAHAAQTRITVDEKELETARWFSAAEVRLMLAGAHPENLFASNPYAIAHHVITAALNQHIAES